jgi:hypothetical protein
MIFSSLGSSLGAGLRVSSGTIFLSLWLQPGNERGDTYPWLVGKVVCLDSSGFVQRVCWVVQVENSEIEEYDFVAKCATGGAAA